MSDQGPSLSDLRQAMMHKAAEIVEKRFPGLILKAALTSAATMSLSLRIREDNVFDVATRKQIPFDHERQEVLYLTDEGEMIIFVKGRNQVENEGSLFHVKPAKK